MKHLLTVLLLSCAVTAPAADKAAARRESAVSRCFKVRRLLRTDSTHYWADWSNTCPFTIDAVYVMVGFLDRGHQEMGSGVWPMYFVKPGAHRVTRFSAPVADFETVLVHRITTDSAVALSPDWIAIKAVNEAAPGTVGDTGIGRILRQPETAGNVTKY